MEEVDVVAARTLQQQGAQLIDVREPYEFAAGHATGARNIPLGQLLRRHGLTQTRNVRGGMMAWHAAGLPEQ